MVYYPLRESVDSPASTINPESNLGFNVADSTPPQSPKKNNRTPVISPNSIKFRAAASFAKLGATDKKKLDSIKEQSLSGHNNESTANNNNNDNSATPLGNSSSSSQQQHQQQHGNSEESSKRKRKETGENDNDDDDGGFDTRIRTDEVNPKTFDNREP